MGVVGVESAALQAERSRTVSNAKKISRFIECYPPCFDAGYKDICTYNITHIKEVRNVFFATSVLTGCGGFDIFCNQCEIGALYE